VGVGNLVPDSHLVSLMLENGVRSLLAEIPRSRRRRRPHGQPGSRLPPRWESATWFPTPTWSALCSKTASDRFWRRYREVAADVGPTGNLVPDSHLDGSRQPGSRLPPGQPYARKRRPIASGGDTAKSPPTSAPRATWFPTPTWSALCSKTASDRSGPTTETSASSEISKFAILSNDRERDLSGDWSSLRAPGMVSVYWRRRSRVKPVRFGVFAPQGWIMDLVEIEDPVEKFEAMTRVAQTAERLGFDSVWLFDHFHTYHKPVLETTFECWTSTAALARDTSRIRIGQMVTCNGYRNPALLAKMASTVDVMSHGRLDFGIGGGWYEHEFNAYGYPYPAVGDRLRKVPRRLHG